MTNASAERAATLSFGVSGIDSGADVAELERAGIDSFWVGGHIASRNPSREAIVGLARLSAQVSTATIGTSILLLPLYPPAVVAKQISEIDRATDGRVVLGVGVGGEFPAEFDAVQVPVEERGRRADEAIPLIRRLWSGEPVSHDGHFYPIDEVRVHPAPLSNGGPPIVAAGRRVPAMRRAARLGDGWMPYMYSPERYTESVTSIRQFAAEAGRDLEGFRWMVWTVAHVADDGSGARKDAARHLMGSADGDFDQMLDRVAVAGDPVHVRDRLCAFADAGVEHFIFSFLPGRVMDQARRFVDEIIPAVRAHRELRTADGPQSDQRGRQ